MKNHFFGLSILLFSLSSFSYDSVNRINDNQNKTQQIDSLMTYCHANGMFNGAIAITRNDTVLFSKSYGFINNESKTKINAETVFYIASMSKQFTAMGIMILKEKGLLDYDDPVIQYLPELKSLGDTVTIRHLLQHTSGVIDKAYYEIQHPNNQDILNSLVSLKPDDFGAPNQRFSYSNTGYVLLAFIIEKVAGLPINEFYKKELFDPLNLTRTSTSNDPTVTDKNKAKSYTIFNEKSAYESSVIGPTGIYSTINDLLKWNTALNENKFVSQETKELAFSNGMLEKEAITVNLGDRTFGYGFGWMPFTIGKDSFVRHDGSTDGFRSLIRKNVSDGVDIILLTNHGGAFAMDEITRGVDAILDGMNYTQPIIPLPIKIANELNENGIQSVVKMLKSTINEDNMPDERVIGRLGFTLQNQGRMEEAIELYKVNLSLFPTSTSALYVLGEAYLSEGEYELAKSIYTTFIELRPTSEYAKGKLDLIEEKLNEKN